MTGWKVRGIEQVYTSVDLDGLHLTEQLYTATDYNPLDWVRQMLDLSPNHPVRSNLAERVSDLSTMRAQYLANWLQQKLKANDLDEYHGIPASWVTRAMQMARTEFGLQLGVRRPDKEQLVVGDIVEYMPPDYQGRTATIAAALLGSMVGVSQGQKLATNND